MTAGRRPPIADRDRRTTDAFNCVADAAARLARLRSSSDTPDARAVGVAADVLGARAGLLDAEGRHRANGKAAELEKRTGASLVGAQVSLGGK